MELMQAMMTRRSIRRYTDEKIPEEKLTRVLQAALLAPTSRDFRPCEFYVVEDRETLTALAGAKQAGAEMLKGAGAAIVVLADAVKSDTWIEDSSIALTSGWYVVNREYNSVVHQTIKIRGDVNLIMTDGAKLVISQVQDSAFTGVSFVSSVPSA